MRVGQAIAEAITVLDSAHVVSARVDAELLAAFVLGVARGRLLTAADFTPAQLERFRGLVRDRASRVPLQYVTGIAPFRHIELMVGPGVFVPRPETELVVEWGLRWLRQRPDGGVGAVVVDLCAGSGAIAVSVAHELPGSRVYAVERDPDALRWLRHNVAEATPGGHGVRVIEGAGITGIEGAGVTVIEGDATNRAVLAELDGQVDLVLCNPPYVPEIAAAGLPAEVIEHDPRVAVFGGTDGLDVIRPLIDRIAGLLTPGGAFGLEHDDTHAYVVPTLVHADGRFGHVELHHDLARRPRFTTAIRIDPAGGVADLPT